jgi:DNA polymerase III alpha subunit (gram-positive type)
MKRLVIDTETTGLSPRFNRTLTVGMLLVDVEKDFLDILDENHVFIKTKPKNLNPVAMRVHGIDLVEHNKVAIGPQEACLEVNRFVEDNDLGRVPLVGHNISFDRGFINALFDSQEELCGLHAEHEDTMHMWNKLKRKEVVPSNLRSTLGSVSEFFDIDYTKAHDALADCHITAKVYREILKLS